MTVKNQIQPEKEWPVRVYRRNQSGWSRIQARNGKGKLIRVHATPRQGCILLPLVKARIHMIRSTSSDSQEENDGNLLVQRRRNTIVVRESERTRTIALAFPTEKNCLEFSDRLVSLNPPEVSSTSTSNNSGGSSQQDAHDTIRGAENASDDVHTYVARLLHDPEFLGFVHRLESQLTSSEDGKQMLDALAKSKN